MVDLQTFRFPLSLIRRISAPLMVIASLFIAIEGIWGPGLFRHWSFVTVVLLIILSLGFVALSDLKRKAHCALMSHLGLWLVLTGGLFGAPDRTDVQMRVFSDGRQENMAVAENGDAVILPFNVALKDFKIDYYDDGCSPKQYTSYLDIGGKELQTSVNQPCRYKGYRIYQSGYDSVNGRYSVLKLVRDPWLPVVALGALLLAIAAILSLKTVWQIWKILLAALVLAAVFAILSVARIKFGTLMPALRSFWFIPGKKKRLVFTILAFLAVQMTWYGVNYLPAANYSLHTYTQEPIL